MGANQSSKQWNLYNEWKDRKNVKFTEWWRRMEREERFEHGFLFSPFWLTGALFGYPFWTSFCLHLLDGEEFDEDNGDDDNEKSTKDDLERRSSGVETSCYLAHKKPEIPLKFLSAHHPPPRYSMASSFASSTPTSVPIFTQAGGLKLPQREDSAISSLNMLSSTISAPSTRRDK